ncbi:tyrosine-type recombinase/integrase [candidate division KSB3 bacterium]|uniref:Tyrosine-type recombinase/integrase n=1 Tax=candidate division KSB3 bacterium TaxID=2044937 RepID=A0A9D5JRV6_9BACT|nr:tyrosine-type recombinase/integrase [candidate division KSB3 bacterium]MBD3323118.1 tyrosine-type recombinase/integrase [candidate division KSB3 bacterium]
MPYKERGVWRAQVRVGRKKVRADFSTKKDAVRWESATRLKLEKERTTQTDTDLLSFCNSYLDHAELRFVKKTFDNKKRVCSRLLAHLDNPPVNDITPAMIQQFLEKQAELISLARFNEDYKHLRAMWSWGIDILGLSGNPVAKIKRLPQNRAPQYTPSTEDVLRVLAVATRAEMVFLQAYLQTGARKSEIFRWTWDDINFEKREVRLGTRKTRDGSMEYEWLPMNEELHEELLWWWKNRPVKDTPFVFVSTSNRHHGKPFTTRRQFMRGLCKRAGVRPFGFHALRRYVASVLADTHKVSSKTIQRILRHKSLHTTERYIYNINRDLDRTMNLLSVNLQPKLSEQVHERFEENP